MHVENKLKWTCFYNDIYTTMKNHNKLSFKKVQSGPNSIDMDKIKVLKKLFAFWFTQNLNNDILIRNWDECLFTRKFKINYLWSKIGFNTEWQNVSFIGSLAIILTIFSNGSWFLLTTQCKINSEIVCWYMNKLYQWLLKNTYFGYKKVTILLDKCSFRKSKATKNNFNLFDATFNSSIFFNISSCGANIWFLVEEKENKNKQSKVKPNSKEANLKLFKVLKLIDG